MVKMWQNSSRLTVFGAKISRLTVSRTTPSPTPDIGGHHGFQRVKLTKQCIFSEALIFYLRENIYFPGINRHFDPPPRLFGTEEARRVGGGS